MFFSGIFDPTFELIKACLLIGGIFLAILFYLALKHKLPALEKKLNTILAAFAFISFASFYNMGNMHFGGGHFHTHDLYHYYMGSKYFKQVGYLHLYDATVQADDEKNKFLTSTQNIRDQRNYEVIPKENAYKNTNEWRQKFSEKEWEEFKNDVVWFQSHPHGVGWWQGIITDFGYNPPPVWTMIASAFSLVIPTSFEAGMILIAYLDAILALVMFYFVFKAFGSRVALFTILFWGATFAPVFSFTGASFLRHDWIIYFVMAICFLKMEKLLPAAFFMALSIGLRVFPLLFLFPVIAALAWKIYEKKKIDFESIRFFVYLALSGLFIFVMTLIFVPGGINAWLAFYEKMHVHKESWNTWNWGFQMIFTYGGEVYDNLPFNWKLEKINQLQNFMPLVIILILLTLSLIAYAARYLSYWEAACIGCITAFMIINPTKYYLVYLITLVPLFAEKLKEKWALISIIGLFGITAFIHFFDSFNQTAILIQFIFCSLLYLFFVYFILIQFKFNKLESYRNV